MTDATTTATIYAEHFFSKHAELFAPYLCEAGLDESVFSPDAEVPLARYVQLWEVLGRNVSPSIGLNIGGKTTCNDLGTLGQAVRSAPTMRLALRCMTHFIAVLQQGAALQLEEHPRFITLTYRITDLTIVERRQDAEFTLAVILTVLRELTGDDQLRPEQVDFEHGKPPDDSKHRELFGCSVRFAQAQDRLYFSKTLLERTLVTSDPRLFGALQTFLETQRQEREASVELLFKVGHHIAGTLASGGTNLQQVAQSIGMSSRTLQRRLLEQNVEFSQLVEEVRCNLAKNYVSNSSTSFTEIALLLGYTEPSSFTRAFRRWTQMAPQAYRQSHQSMT